MQLSQVKSAGILFVGQIVIKIANFLKQILLAFFLGVSADIDLFLAAQIVPAILSSMVAGGAGEVLVTSIEKKDKFNHELIAIFIFIIAIITVAVGLLFLLSVPVWIKVFKISSDRISLFGTLVLFMVCNKFAESFVSTLKPLLFYRNRYNYYVFTSLFSEFIGILVIIVLVEKLGIVAFAWGVLITSSINALLFFNIHGLSFIRVLKKSSWEKEWVDLKVLLYRVFSLSMQTMVNHLSTFWERTLSMRFLAPGYLSALNYSKSLSEMPKMIMLSSILTTTYIEQVKYKAENEENFINYSNKME